MLKCLFYFYTFLSCCGLGAQNIESAGSLTVVSESDTDQSLLTPANSPLVLYKCVLNRVFHSVTNSQHRVVQTTHWAQTARQNSTSVEEERFVSDSETYVQRTFAKCRLERFFAGCYLLAAWILQLEDFVDLVSSASSLFAYVWIVLLKYRTFSGKKLAGRT